MYPIQRAWIAVIALTLLLPACGTPTPEGPAQPVDRPAEVAPPSEDPLATDNTLCFGDRRKVTLETRVTTGAGEAVQQGYRLDLPTAADDRLVLGVLANIENSTPGTQANLDRFLAAFEEAAVDAIVVAGDVGDTRADLDANLGKLGASGRPVLVLIGNRESRVDFEGALDAIREDAPAVFNLNRVRRVNTPAMDLVTLPGFNDRNYVHKADGCVYDALEIQFLSRLTEEADSPVLLVAHAAHMMEGEDAIDHAIDTGNIGNPDLREWVLETKVRFGIYANAQEAGGKGTDAVGTRAVKPATPVSELFVNPGPAMADPWTMNDRSESRGMGLVLTFADKRLSYEVIRIEAAESTD